MVKDNRRKANIAIVVMIVIALVISGLALSTQTSNAACVKVGTVSSVQVNTVGKDKLKISWNKSGKISGVKVYQTVSGKTKLVKTTKGKTYTTKKLKKNTTYKYVVRPYYKKSGKTYNGKKSYSVTARTARSSKKNVSKIKFTTYSKTMTVGKAKTFKVKLYGSKLISKTVRWSSSKTTVASVSSKGYVKAKKVGTAYIYAKAHNGKTTRFKVTVKSQATSTTGGTSTNSNVPANHAHRWLPVFEEKTVTTQEGDLVWVTVCVNCGEILDKNEFDAHVKKEVLSGHSGQTREEFRPAHAGSHIEYEVIGHKCSICGLTEMD